MDKRVLVYTIANDDCIVTHRRSHGVSSQRNVHRMTDSTNTGDAFFLYISESHRADLGMAQAERPERVPNDTATWRWFM